MAIEHTHLDRLYCLQCIHAAHATEAVNTNMPPSEPTVRSLRCATASQLEAATSIGRVRATHAVWFSPPGDESVIKCPTCDKTFKTHACAEILDHANRCGPAPSVSCNACKTRIVGDADLTEQGTKLSRITAAVKRHQKTVCLKVRCSVVGGFKCAFVGSGAEVDEHVKNIHCHELAIDDLIQRSREVPALRATLVLYVQGVFCGRFPIPKTINETGHANGEVRNMFASLNTYAEEHAPTSPGMRKVLLFIRQCSRMSVKELARLVSTPVAS